MVFCAIFWSMYVPFVLLTLSIFAEHLFHQPESDAALRARRVPASVQPQRRLAKK